MEHIAEAAGQCPGGEDEAQQNFYIGDDIRAIVVDWVNFLRKERLWCNDDPLFPATEIGNGPDQRFEVIALAASIGACRGDPEDFQRGFHKSWVA